MNLIFFDALQHIQNLSKSDQFRWFSCVNNFCFGIFCYDVLDVHP